MGFDILLDKIPRRAGIRALEPAREADGKAQQRRWHTRDIAVPLCCDKESENKPSQFTKATKAKKTNQNRMREGGPTVNTTKFLDSSSANSTLARSFSSRSRGLVRTDSQPILWCKS